MGFTPTVMRRNDLICRVEDLLSRFPIVEPLLSHQGLSLTIHTPPRIKCLGSSSNTYPTFQYSGGHSKPGHTIRDKGKEGVGTCGLAIAREGSSRIPYSRHLQMETNTPIPPVYSDTQSNPLSLLYRPPQNTTPNHRQTIQTLSSRERC